MSKRLFKGILLITALSVFFGLFLLFKPAQSSAAINPQINFQGKLTNPDGTNVTNGTYSIRFRMYDDPSLDSANPCVANSCKWEETQGSVSITDGIFQVALGSVTGLPGSVDFNTSGIYLGIKVGADLEMTPRIRFTASPYAFNADKLGGLSNTNFVQLAQGLQADASTTNPSIAINKTGITAKILQLQRAGVDVFNVNNDGSVLIKTPTNSATALQVQNTLSGAVLTADTINSRVSVGALGTAEGQFYVGGQLPTAAVSSSAINAGGGSFGVAVRGNYVYLQDGQNANDEIWDVSNPASPLQVNSSSPTVTPASNTVVQGNYSYAAGNNFLDISDITNPFAPAQTSHFDLGTNVSNHGSIAVTGRYAYIVDQNAGNMYMYDVSNPAAPYFVHQIFIGSANASTTKSTQVVVQGRYVYMVNTINSFLRVFDTTNNTFFVNRSNTATGASPSSLAVNGRYAYVTNGSASGLQVFDISNPAIPVSVTSVATGTSPVSINISGNYAYVLNNGSNTMQVFDISNPASPASLGTVTTDAGPNTMTIQGRFAYVITDKTLQVFDLGGAYIQSLNAGDVSATSLNTQQLNVDNSASVGGALSVGGAAQVNGGLGVNGQLNVQTPTNSATALTVQSSNGEAAFNVSTTPINNFITNPSFEVDTTGWTAVGGGTSLTTSSPAFIGSKAMGVSTTGVANSGAKYVTGSGATQLGTSTTYAFSWYASGSSSTMMGAYARDGSTETNCTNINTQVTKPTFWVRFTCNIVTDGTLPSAGAYIIIKNTSAAVVSFTLDGIQIESNVTATPYQQSSISLIGVINSPVTFRSLTSSSTAFGIQNAIGAAVLSVDTNPINTFIINGGNEGTSSASWALKAGSGTVSRDNTVVYSGQASEKIALTSTAIGDGGKYSLGTTTVLPSTQYTVSFSIKQTVGTAFGANLEAGFNSGADIPCVLSPTLAAQAVPTTGWARYSCTFNSDASPSFLDYLYWKELDAPGVARTFYIDNLQLEQGAISTAYKETSIELNGLITSPVAFKNANDSVTALLLQNAGGLDLFQIDTLNSRVYIGGDTPDATGIVLVLDNKNTAGDPTGVDGGMYYNADSRRSRCYANTLWSDCQGTPRVNTRRWAFLQYPGSGLLFSLLGDVQTSAVAPTAVATTNTEPGMLNYATSGVNGNVNSVSGNLNYDTDNSITYQTYVAVTPVTAVRIWAGITNQTAATMGAAANPAGNYAAFRFDVGAGDANYKCITKDNVTQNIQSSGVVPAAGVGRKLEIVQNPTSVIFLIDGTRVCTNVANLPAANTLMRYVNVVEAQAAAVKNIQIGWIYLETDK